MKRLALLLALSILVPAAPAAAEHAPSSSCVSGWEWAKMRAAIRESGTVTLVDLEEYLDGGGEVGPDGQRQFRVCRRASKHTRVVVTVGEDERVTGVWKVHPGKGFAVS